MFHHARSENHHVKYHASRTCMVLLALSLFLVSPLREARSSVDLIPLEGKPIEARLMACTSQGAWDFDIAGQITSLPATDFIRWGNPANKLAGPVLFLTDGSRLVADEAFTQLQIKEDEVHFDSKSIGENTRLPLQWIEAIVLTSETNGQRRDLWLEHLRQQPRERDVVLMENEDLLEGTVVALGERELLLLRNSGETLRIARQNVKAIAFQPALLERPEPLQQFLILQLSDGSSLRAASWKGNAKNIQVRTAGGANALTFNIASKGSATRKQIVGLLPIGFESVFLSDLEEAAYQHHPFLSLHWPYRRDRSVLGERLQTQSKLYEKGIGMHTDAELTFRLEQPFKRLDGAVGIDDSAEDQGSVIFEVDVQRGDANWNTAFRSRMLRGGEPAEPFSVDLEGVKGIRLKAGHAVDGDTLDRANWLDVRLLR